MQNNQENEAPRTAEALGFPCKSCGHQMAYSPAHGKLFCAYCQSEVAIDSECREAPEYLYYPSEGRYDAPAWDLLGTRTLTCPSCGADTVLSAATVTANCPYCGSHYVTELTAEEKEESIRPESLVPFRVPKEKAAAQFAEWAKGRRLSPRAFRRARHNTEMQGLYVPFFTYDASLTTHYSGQGGIRRTEVYTVRVNGKTQTRTRTVTDWYPISGTEQLSFDDIPCPATKKLDLALFRRLGAYSMKVLSVYNPAYLAGFLAERYSVGLGEGFDSVRHTMELRMEQHIKATRHYDTYRFMQYDHHYKDVRFKHFLLPLWLATYRYRDKVYQFMVNGETGKVAGRAPLSPWKIFFIVLGAIGFLGLIFLLLSLGEGSL